MKNAKALGVDGRLGAARACHGEDVRLPGDGAALDRPRWAKLDEAQRVRFIGCSASLILRTYATRFDGYTYERFEMRSTEASIAGTEIVRTTVHSPQARPCSSTTACARRPPAGA